MSKKAPQSRIALELLETAEDLRAYGVVSEADIAHMRALFEDETGATVSDDFLPERASQQQAEREPLDADEDLSRTVAARLAEKRRAIDVDIDDL